MLNLHASGPANYVAHKTFYSDQFEIEGAQLRAENEAAWITNMVDSTKMSASNYGEVENVFNRSDQENSEGIVVHVLKTSHTKH